MNTYCKVCSQELHVGDSMLLHIFQEHPRQFVNMIIQLNPEIVEMTHNLFTIGPEK